MDILKALEEFDITSNESKVYVELLKLGSTLTGPLVERTELHRQQVYQALRELEKQDLVTVVIKNNRKHFTASSPDRIRTALEQKAQLADQLIPQLESLRTLPTDTLEVRTLHGRKGLHENLRDISASAARHDQLIRIVGGAPSEHVYRSTEGMYQEYLDHLKANKITRHLITAPSLAEGYALHYNKEQRGQMKVMHEGLSAPTFTRTTLDMVSIEMYAEDVITIQITSPTVAKGYVDHFNLLWKLAVPAQKA